MSPKTVTCPHCGSDQIENYGVEHDGNLHTMVAPKILIACGGCGKFYTHDPRGETLKEVLAIFGDPCDLCPTRGSCTTDCKEKLYIEQIKTEVNSKNDPD